MVDLYGNVNSLPKLIDDKLVRTADIRAFLGGDFPVESLPSVEEAERLAADHRKVIERSLSEDRYADKLAMLQQSQQERRATVERERGALNVRQQQSREVQHHEHRAQRDALRRTYRQTAKEIRAARVRDRPTGLAAFLGRVSGVEMIRKAMHRHQDGQLLKTYRANSRNLGTRQEQELRALEGRQAIQAREPVRKEAAWLAAFHKLRQEIHERSDVLIDARGFEGRHVLRALLQRNNGPRVAT